MEFPWQPTAAAVAAAAWAGPYGAAELGTVPGAHQCARRERVAGACKTSSWRELRGKFWVEAPEWTCDWLPRKGELRVR